MKETTQGVYFILIICSVMSLGGQRGGWGLRTQGYLSLLLFNSFFKKWDAWLLTRLKRNRTLRFLFVFILFRMVLNSERATIGIDECHKPSAYVVLSRTSKCKK